MKRIYKLGEKVRILWDKTEYRVNPDYLDTGKVMAYFQAPNGRMLVQLYNFHKIWKYHSLHFTTDTVRPLKEVVKDGDAL